MKTNNYSLEHLVFIRDNLLVEQKNSKYGVCQITGIPFDDDKDQNRHHIIPREYGGDDSWSNLIIIKVDVHKLIHSTNVKNILRILEKYNFSDVQLKTINYYRKLAHRKPVFLAKPKKTNISKISEYEKAA